MYGQGVKTLTDPPEPALFDFDGAQHYLGDISRSLLKKLSKSQIRTIKIGRRRLFPRAALDAFIAERVDAK